MNAVEVALAGMLGSPGLVGVALLDGTTGLLHASAGQTGAIGPGADLADLAALVTDRLGTAGAEGELESFVVTTTHWHHVMQAVPQRGGGLLLCAVLDRASTNLALALRDMAEHARLVLA